MNYYIDFEATQFSERIISIGCIAENGKTFTSLVKPAKNKDKVNNFITKLTGITNEMLETAPTADEAFNAFFDFIIETTPSDELPEYYCYGDNDARFIERTVAYMTDVRASTFALAIQYTLIDFSKEARMYFNLQNIALRKIYALLQEEEEIQYHNALEDAKMLSAVVAHMKEKCQPNQRTILTAMPREVKPTKDGRLPQAPQKFILWPNDKWVADTGADETNYKIACKVGPHTKYFDSIDTAALWLMRYCTKGMSVKNLKHHEIVKNRIIEGLTKGKQSYGFEWIERKDETCTVDM